MSTKPTRQTFTDAPEQQAGDLDVVLAHIKACEAHQKADEALRAELAHVTARAERAEKLAAAEREYRLAWQTACGGCVLAQHASRILAAEKAVRAAGGTS